MRSFLVFALLLSGCAQQVITYSDAGEGLQDSGSDPDSGLVAADSGLPADSGTPVDVGFPDASIADVGIADAGIADTGASECIVDPFGICDDPLEDARRNDDWTSASRYSGSVGCLTGDNFTQLMETERGVLCQTEPADYYALTIVPCDSLTMRLEVRLHMLTECPASEYELEVRFGGGVRRCGDEFEGTPIECIEEGQDRVMRVLIPPGDSVQSWYFAVVSDHTNVAFDYDMQVNLR